jgi:arabinogalactan endo-1,4-beta-galactosidase
MNVLPRVLLLVIFFCLPAMAEKAPDMPRPAERTFATGVDANFARDMAAKTTAWKVGGKEVDLFDALHAAGIDSFRVRVWTGKDGPSGRDYACAVAKRAQEAGLKPHLVFFLSENWADYVKQPAPAEWAKLPFAEKLAKVSSYSEETARHFKQAGVETDLYAIGNEIDFGICGEFEEKWERRFDMGYMNERIWSKAAQVIRAAEQGIQRVNPKARFILHLTQWWNPEFCTAFLEAMRRHEVQVDLLGLSFYPSSGLCEKKTFADLGASVGTIVAKNGPPVIICETAYPSLPSFGGQFATWNKAVDGYPLSEEGQRKWIADFFAFCRDQKDIHGAFYWSPEWYTEEMWKAFALFRADGAAKEGLDAFRAR